MSTVPWNPQIFSLDIPVDGKPFDLTTLYATITSIENRTSGELCIADLSKKGLDQLFEENDNILKTIPPKTSMKTVGFQPFTINRPYKLILYPRTSPLDGEKITINMIPVLTYSGHSPPHDFILGDECYRNVEGKVSKLSDEYLLMYLKKQTMVRL